MAEETAPQSTPPAAPPAPPPAPAAIPAPVEAAPPETRIKVRKPRQRSCNEKDAKGKLCAGHLKRWYDYPQEVVSKIGKDAEIYRCEFCKTLYKPDPRQLPHSFTLNY
jgi:3-oxoacyl-ACP reductase-like protein